VAVKARQTTQLSGASTSRRSEALAWRRSEAPTWRHTWRRACSGGRAVEADMEEERAPVGVWWGNERVRV
jgi:hypothetical protein